MGVSQGAGDRSEGGLVGPEESREWQLAKATMKTDTAVDIDATRAISVRRCARLRRRYRVVDKTIITSQTLGDPDWVREFRLKGLKTFLEKPLPTHWASKDLEAIDFDKIRYYLSGGVQPKRNWEDVPDDVKRTFERLGIPEQERKFLAGVEAQFDSEAVYSTSKSVGDKGVIFVGSTRFEESSRNFRKWFGKYPNGDTKFRPHSASSRGLHLRPPGVK